MSKRKKHNSLPDPSYRAKSCTGKKKYRSEMEALAMLDTQREYGEEMDGVHPYRCEFCKQWHLGHELTD